MWYLENFKSPSEKYLLPTGHRISIGRGHDVSITLHGDGSVSKQHAVIFIKDKPSSQASSVQCFQVTDVGSKFGTHVLEEGERVEDCAVLERLPLGEARTFPSNTLIKYGFYQSVWRIVCRPLVVTSSQLSDKDRLREQVGTLGGEYTDRWLPNCTHLVMKGIKITEKTACALASGADIVSPEFMSVMLDTFQHFTCVPNPSDFIPPLQEVGLKDGTVFFLPDSRRKEVFIGKHFIFLSEKSLKKLQQVVALAGGTCSHFRESDLCRMSTDKIFVHSLGSSVPTSAKAFLEKHRMHTVPESDIALAIVYLDTQKYCNPLFRHNLFHHRESSSTCKDADVIAYDTPSMCNDGTLSTAFQASSSLVPPTRSTVVPSDQRSRWAECYDPRSGQTAGCHMKSPNDATHMMQSSSLHPRNEGSHTTDSSFSSKRTVSPGSKDHSHEAKKRKLTTDVHGKASTSTAVCTALEQTCPMSQEDGLPEILNESSFAPVHVSTQIGAQELQSKKATLGTSKESSPATRISAATKSIPFEPFTLPTLAACLTTEGTPEANVSKVEHPSLPFKTKSASNASCWLDIPSSGDKRLDIPSSGDKRLDVPSFGDKRLDIPSSGDKRLDIPSSGDKRLDIPSSDDKRLDIPSSGDKRLTSRAQEQLLHPSPPVHNKRLREETEEQLMAVKLERRDSTPSEFALPVVTTRQRKTYGRNKEYIEEPKRRNTFQLTESAAARTINGSTRHTPLPEVQQNADATCMNDKLVSRSFTSVTAQNEVPDGNSSYAQKTPSADVKKEPSDVDGVATSFEGSLVVVEVVSLLRKPVRPTLQSSSRANCSTTVNFKKFVKVTLRDPSIGCQEVETLPRIIGGSDLVVYSSPKEDAHMFEELIPACRPREEEQQNSDDCKRLFELPIKTQRNRSRRRVEDT